MKILLMLLSTGALMAQSGASLTTGDAPVMRAEARVVQVDVLVTDSQGRPVTGLTKEDFTIRDEGKIRHIDIFSVTGGLSVDPGPVAQAPAATNVFSNRNPAASQVKAHSTVIIIDNVNTTFRDWVSARQAVTSLMSKVPPDERIALYLIAVKMGLIVIQDYTIDRQLLVSRLESYIPRGLHPDTGPVSAIAPPSPKTFGPASPTRSPEDREGDFFSAEGSRQARGSLQAMADHLSLIPGRKSVFWISNGIDPKAIWINEKQAWDKTIEALNDANVAVNTVDLRGPKGDRARAIAAERDIADRTGGHSWFGTNDVDAMLAQGIANSRTMYTLAFYLPEKERDAKFHRLEVRTCLAGLELSHRQGYYAGETPLSKSVREKGQELESVLLNPVDSDGIGITARVDVAGNTIHIRATIDPAGQVSVIEFNAGGSTLAKVSDKRKVDDLGMSIPLLPGAVKIAIVVRDPKSGRIGSLTVPLKTPRD